MKKQINSSRHETFVIFVLIVCICIALAGCDAAQDVSGSTDESIVAELPNNTSGNQSPKETNSVTVPSVSESTPAQTETAPIEVTQVETAPIKAGLPETTPTETTHAHSYSSKVTAPSCKADGYTTFTCNCGDTYTTDHTDAVGHNYGEKVIAATCTEMGYCTYTCSVCGNSYTENKSNPIGHSWGNWTVTKKPTTTAEGQEQRICKTCDKTELRSIEKLAYERFTGSIGNYNACNLAYVDSKGDTEKAAFIEVYTIEKSDQALSNLVAEFKKVYGYTPSLEGKSRCTTSCTYIGTYLVEDYAEPQTVYHYTITDKTYIYITNEMYKVYVQQCADGSVWVGYCIYGTMDTLRAERNKANVKALDKEMYATFEDLIGLNRNEMDAYKGKLELKIGYISEAGTVRSAHSDTPVQVLYIFCRGFVYSHNNS